MTPLTDPRTILIVEDDEDDALMFRHVIENLLRYQAILARDGQEAVQLASQQTFDLVILDVRLPSLDGEEVARAIRHLDRYQSVPLLALTAYDQRGMRQRCLKAGCTLYMTKPVDIDYLMDAINRQFAA